MEPVLKGSYVKTIYDYAYYWPHYTGISALVAYGRLKCERKEDRDCPAVLRAAWVMGRNGSVFHASNKYVRLSLIRSQDDFDLLLRKIDALVSQE
ncbi:hypothetical protein Scep_030145 [Stephania cephalantha]|uniref:Alliinase C-terminal domain-containing protein n=1 Tax=Stephania cephalantha TaxID=152367 RepID=A0AAP0DZ03_9MAGN